MNKLALRKFWFQFHKWIGLLLAILILPISVTGAVLVWHEPLDAVLNPQRHVSAGVRAELEPAAYVDAAKAALAPGEKIVALRFAEGEAVTVAAAQPGKRGGGRPGRTVVYMDPASAKVLDVADGNGGFMRVMHQLHGSLMIPGMGRQIVGWVGVAMLISSLSGLWLWWPLSGSVTRGFRWKQGDRKLDTNLHHQMGFWIALPLFVLSLTGAWISFPAFFGTLSGDAPQQRPGQPDRLARMRAKPIDNPRTSLPDALAAARPLAEKPLTSVDWPTDLEGRWSFSFAGQTVKVDEQTGVTKAEEKKARQAPPETTARLMRRIHDGTNMGIVWQVIIFLGGILPAILTVTGLTMWWRSRKWRGGKKRGKQPATAI